jgi:hypothetical protein
MTNREISALRPEPWPLLTTVAAVWVLVAAVALGVALGDGDGPRLEAIPWDHLVALELLSLVTWVALSVPGLALIRLPWLSRLSLIRALLIGGTLGLGFSLIFALVEQQLLHLVTTPAHEAFAAQILPDLDARILGFLAMVALARVTPVLAVEVRRPASHAPAPRPPAGGVPPLMTQLQSHFLFNTLNDAAELVHVDPQAADDVITRLSEFLRAALVHTREELVPLRQELGFIRAYTEIQAVRLRDRLTVEWELAPETLDAAIPIFVWQPILENAFRHGAEPGTGRVALEIGARREGTDLVFWIRDHGAGVGRGREGQGAGSVPGQGIGLRNTRDRVTRLFGGSGSVEIGALEDGTVAVLRLPFARYEGVLVPPALP